MDASIIILSHIRHVTKSPSEKKHFRLIYGTETVTIAEVNVEPQG